MATKMKKCSSRITVLANGRSRKSFLPALFFLPRILSVCLWWLDSVCLHPPPIVSVLARINMRNSHSAEEPVTCNCNPSILLRSYFAVSLYQPQVRVYISLPSKVAIARSLLFNSDDLSRINGPNQDRQPRQTNWLCAGAYWVWHGRSVKKGETISRALIGLTKDHLTKR